MREYLGRLDRLGIIELRPLNRYRLKLAKGFRWRPHGPVMRTFASTSPPTTSAAASRATASCHAGARRDQPALAASLVERLQPRRPGLRAGAPGRPEPAAEQRTPYTLLVGMRTWLFAAFRDLKREPPPP